MNPSKPSADNDAFEQRLRQFRPRAPQVDLKAVSSDCQEAPADQVSLAALSHGMRGMAVAWVCGAAMGASVMLLISRPPATPADPAERVAQVQPVKASEDSLASSPESMEVAPPAPLASDSRPASRPAIAGAEPSDHGRAAIAYVDLLAVTAGETPLTSGSFRGMGEAVDHPRKYGADELTFVTPFGTHRAQRGGDWASTPATITRQDLMRKMLEHSVPRVF